MSERGSNTERFNDELTRLNVRLASLARRNLLSEAVQAEYLYRDLLNRLFGWDLVDANEGRSNFEAVDLVDESAKVAVQVSVTRDEGKVGKVNDALAKDAMRRYAEEGFRVAFCFIGEQGDSVKKSKAVRNPRGVLFDQGDVPLSECYIEPTVDVGGEGGSHLTVREWVESFVAGDDTVAVLCGEPGHGKTSLCRKAVADFYKAGWLAGRVSNVFCFSLNPANTDALANGRLNLYSLLSWGGDRTDHDHRIKVEHCRGALVLLDAFDELLEWHPAFDLGGFVRDHVLRVQQETGSHVIVTTRGMVVDQCKDELQVNRRTSVPIVRLRPITREQQLGWINRYAERLRGKLAGDSASSLDLQGDEANGELGQLEAYAKRFSELDEGTDFQKVLGVPIIFRMVVAARYLPKSGESITRMYDDLFDATWGRHDHGDAGPSPDPREVARARLSRHALRVFADDADTAVVDDVTKSPWTFAFYTTHKSDGGRQGRSRVGFLHRSFYQHFLACEVLSWFTRYTGGDDYANTFRDNLSYLARRRLDETTLGYIREMYGDVEDRENLALAFDKAYEVLKETDGILPPPRDERDTAQMKSVAPLKRANNVFWNVVSVCSVCGHELNADKVSTLALQSYRLDGCHMENAHLDMAHLEGARLVGADLRGADLEGAHYTNEAS